MLRRIRGFFQERSVLEVETPVLCPAGTVDEHLDPIHAAYHLGGEADRSVPLYLQTSPELCMKRLLCEGSGPIYQVTRAFRDGERGRLHHPEFTILEWYRPGTGPDALMDEVEDLVRTVLAPDGYAARPFRRITYREAFLGSLGIDPLTAPLEELGALVREKAGAEEAPGDRDACLNVLLAAFVEPDLGGDSPAFIHDYPASQAALARVRDANPPVAERFELYVRGIELANGYHELTDAAEQRGRFEAANRKRRAAGRPVLPLDEEFLQALESGMPDCSGVALGVDRLVMLAAGCRSIDEVLACALDV